MQSCYKIIFLLQIWWRKNPITPTIVPSQPHSAPIFCYLLLVSVFITLQYKPKHIVFAHCWIAETVFAVISAAADWMEKLTLLFPFQSIYCHCYPQCPEYKKILSVHLGFTEEKEKKACNCKQKSNLSERRFSLPCLAHEGTAGSSRSSGCFHNRLPHLGPRPSSHLLWPSDLLWPLPQACSRGGGPVPPTGAAPVLGSGGEHPAGTPPFNSSKSRFTTNWCLLRNCPPAQHGWRAGPAVCCRGSGHLTHKHPKLAPVSFCRSLNYDPIAPCEAALSLSRVPSSVQALFWQRKCYNHTGTEQRPHANMFHP